MSMQEDLHRFYRAVGGTPVAMATGPTPDVAYNFGLAAAPPPLVGEVVGMPREHGVPREAVPTFRSAAPHLVGKYDGKSTYNWFEVVRRLNGGKDLPAQRQPRGTCVGRGASYAANVRQFIQMADPEHPRTKFEPISHEWCYAGARTRGGLLRMNGDGAQGRDAALWCRDKGALTQQEAKSPGYVDDDSLAVAWGSRGIPSTLMPAAADNPWSEVVELETLQDAYDVLASGGTVTVASDQGFAMTRDARGVCRASGVWMHQMSFSAIIAVGGVAYLACVQSWGPNVPDGPPPPGCPDNSFLVHPETADRMIRQQDSMGISGIVGWDDPTERIPLDWIL
jgi:hypothetical protein